MELFKKLSFTFTANILEQVRQATLVEMATLDLNSSQIYFLKNPKIILNRYLQQNYPGTPELFNCILFHRPANFPQALHLDCNNDDPPKIMNCAINIPIKNCEDSYMEWYDGEYNTKVNSAKGADGIIRKYLDLEWKGQPNLINRTIIDTPTLVKVGIPHKVTVVDKTRSLITLRFQDNPTFEDISKLTVNYSASF